jgi:ketosteroid isomerase-like protein
MNVLNRLSYAPAILLVPLVAISVTLSGCKTTPASDSSAIPQTSAPAQSDEATIRALDAEWSESAGAHNLEATVEPYADGAMLLPPDASAITDKKAIRDYWRAFLDTVDTISWEVKTIQVAKSGELAYVTGTWKTTSMGFKDSIVTDTGKFLEVWKKQSDGKWQCSVDIFNFDKRPPTGAK